MNLDQSKSKNKKITREWKNFFSNRSTCNIYSKNRIRGSLYTCNYLNLFFIVILGILRDKENEADTATESGVQQRRLTNHSARKFMLQKFDDCGFEHNHIKQVIILFKLYVFSL